MTEPEGKKQTVNQVAVQVAKVVMMALTEAEEGPWPTTIASHREQQRQ